MCLWMSVFDTTDHENLNISNVKYKWNRFSALKINNKNIKIIHIILSNGVSVGQRLNWNYPDEWRQSLRLIP